MDIIDQQDGLALQLSLSRWCNGEGATDHLVTLPGIKAAQRGRPPGSDKHFRVDIDARQSGKMATDQGRLIEAPPPQPPTMQRHRHDQHRVSAFDGDMAEHLLGDQAREADPSPIFEAKRNSPRDIAIGEDSARPIDLGPVGDAATT
jgi:hypothetical protein